MVRPDAVVEIHVIVQDDTFLFDIVGLIYIHLTTDIPVPAFDLPLGRGSPYPSHAMVYPVFVTELIEPRIAAMCGVPLGAVVREDDLRRSISMMASLIMRKTSSVVHE